MSFESISNEEESEFEIIITLQLIKDRWKKKEIITSDLTSRIYSALKNIDWRESKSRIRSDNQQVESKVIILFESISIEEESKFEMIITLQLIKVRLKKIKVKIRNKLVRMDMTLQYHGTRFWQYR